MVLLKAHGEAANENSTDKDAELEQEMIDTVSNGRLPTATLPVGRLLKT